MGREVKRVPLDFDWPIGKVWAGYMIPTCQADSIGCEDCRLAAKLRGMKMTSYDCPDFEPFVGPPKGEGWQMWETTSDGSPISPPCKSAEDLAKWLAENKASAFGSSGATYEQWLGMINAGWAPSLVVHGGKFENGVEYIANHEGE